MTYDPSALITDTASLVDFFAACAVPKSQSMVASCAVQAFPYRLNGLTPVAYDEAQGLLALFEGMQDYGWDSLWEDGGIIGIKRRDATITIEAGCQLTISGTAAATLHETSAETDQILSEINHIGEQLGIGFLGIGFHPTARLDDIPTAPFARFRAAREAAAQQGPASLDVLLRSCNTQIGLNFTSEADMIKKFRVASALQPIVTALFANSPFCEGVPGAGKSLRQCARNQHSHDFGERILMAFDPAFGFERYVEWSLDQPLSALVFRSKGVDSDFPDFRAFLHPPSDRPARAPTLGDWVRHLESANAGVLLSTDLRLNGADSGPSEMMLALSGFWIGLLGDDAALENAWKIIQFWNPDDIVQLRVDAPRFGFEADIGGFKVLDIAQVTLTLAQQGLRRRANRLHGGVDEGRYLEVLFDYTESYQTRADQFLMQREHFPSYSIQQVFDACRLTAPQRPPAEQDDIFFA